MMKMFLALLLFSSNVFADDRPDVLRGVTPTPIMGFTIPQKIEFQTIKDFYKMAVHEYKDANYGCAKELFEATVQRTDAFPKAHFYLGCIYGNDYLPFHNVAMATKQYRYCIANRKSTDKLKQICYEKILLEGKLNKDQVAKLMEESKKISDKSYYYKDSLAVANWVNDVGQLISSKTDKLMNQALDVKGNGDISITEPAHLVVGE